MDNRLTLMDTHCHLDYLARDGTDLQHVVDNAKQNHIKQMVTISTKLNNIDSIKSIAHRFHDIYYTVGIHPHEADNYPECTANDLEYYITDTKCVGIGETGLDYYYEKSSIANQQRLFQEHINIACDHNLPVIIHTRNAENDTIKILQRHYAKSPFTAIMHCFTSSQYLAQAALELGFYISFSGILTFKNAQDLHYIAQQIPDNKLLVETDSPYLAPVPHRGKKNQPAYCYHTAEFLATLRDIPMSKLAAITYENSLRVFPRIPPYKDV